MIYHIRCSQQNNCRESQADNLSSSCRKASERLQINFHAMTYSDMAGRIGAVLDVGKEICWRRIFAHLPPYYMLAHVVGENEWRCKVSLWRRRTCWVLMKDDTWRGSIRGVNT